MPSLARRLVGLVCLVLGGTSPMGSAARVPPDPAGGSGLAVPERPDEGRQSDLDAFMEQVLARRDDNWKKLQQYVLEEREVFDLAGPGGMPLYGFRREYSWFIKQGIFVRSPVRADGVKISEADRRKAEAAWIDRERRRDERRRQRAQKAAVDQGQAEAAPPASETPATVEDVLKQGIEPRFVSAAYFLKFQFESGRYALAGRQPIDGRPSLRIEYYPQEGLFNEGRTRPDRRVRDRDEEIEQKMNKVSLVTLWVDPETHQILQYTFDNIGLDFLPGRALARVDDMKATMRMSQPFPGVWLPSTIDLRFGMTLAVGTVDATYRVDYHDYKQADVTYRIK